MPEPIYPPYPFILKPAAKSSSTVMVASVCQSCGCKLDGRSLKKACACRCHVKGPR